MKIHLTKMAALFSLLPLICSGAEDNHSLNFPVRTEKILALDGGEYEIRLHDLPGKGATGFAWSAMRNGYLIKFEIIDGIGPSIISTPALHKNQFGILYKAGAHQSVFDVISLYQGALSDIMPGLISSNLSCIYSGATNTLSAVSEDNGQIITDRFLVTETGISRLPAHHANKSAGEAIMKNCSEKSYFRDEGE